MNEATVVALRVYAAGGRDEATVATLDAAGVFLPVETVEASGRAKCRGCGNKIPHGAVAVAFDYDPAFAAGAWGHAHRAYIHGDFCPPEGATGA